MATKELEVSQKTLRYAHGTMCDWFGVDLTDDQIIEIGKSDREVWKDMLMGEFDTVTRENFGDAMVRYVMGSGNRWPRYKDAQADHFFVKFEAAARQKGIKIR
jgi:hypothetical protein